jgi:hypothetical protein
MRAEHVLTIHCRCPKNERLDEYELTVISHDLIYVEDILATVKELAAEPTFQEVLTERLAERLGAAVITVGYHSGVRTTCRVGTLSESSLCSQSSSAISAGSGTLES